MCSRMLTLRVPFYALNMYRGGGGDLTLGPTLFVPPSTNSGLFYFIINGIFVWRCFTRNF